MRDEGLVVISVPWMCMCEILNSLSLSSADINRESDRKKKREKKNLRPHLFPHPNRSIVVSLCLDQPFSYFEADINLKVHLHICSFPFF